MRNRYLYVGLIFAVMIMAFTFVGCGTKNVDVNDEQTSNTQAESTSETDYSVSEVSGEKKKSDISDFKFSDIDDATCYVSGISGDAQIIDIPSEYDGKKVIGIEEYSFAGNKYFEEIYIPASVSVVKNNAFMGCTNIDKVVFSEGTETIEYEAFLNCSSLKTIIFSDGLKEIQSRAFFDNSAEEIILPGTVEIIETSAFSSGVIEDIVIPKNVKKIGQYAFQMDSLKSITIKGANTEIEDDSFGAPDDVSDKLTFYIVKDSAAESVLKEYGYKYNFI